MSDYLPPPPGPPEDRPPAYPPPPPPAAGPSAYGPSPSAYPPAGPADTGRPVDELGRPLAAWGQRLGAIVIDEIFIFVMSVCAAIVVGIRHTYAAALLSWLLAGAYYAVLNGSEMGQTFGKRLLGIQVRDAASPESIGVGRAALRYVIFGLFRIVQFFGLFTLLDCVWPLWDGQRQALHDKIAGSVVVRVMPS